MADALDLGSSAARHGGSSPFARTKEQIKQAIACFFVSSWLHIKKINIIFIFLIICGILLVYSAQFGFLSHTGLFENKSTIAKDYNKVDRSLRRLVGRSGKTVSALTLGGKAKIAGKIYDVVSINSYVEPNKHIRVVEIKDNQIMVRRWFE